MRTGAGREIASWTLQSLSAIFLVAAISAGAEAQSYPARPIRLILPFPPGGATDILGRIVGQKLSEALGQPVVADNRPGAGGYLGLELAAKAQPDGHTIVLGSLVLASGPSLYRKTRFDPLRDLAPISQISRSPNLVLVHPSLPVKTLTELVEYARAHPGKLNYGSSGVGSPLHLAAELLKAVTRIHIVHVPYKGGGGPAMTGLLGGEVQMMVLGAAALPQIQAGRVRALAVLGDERWQMLPEVPTAKEAGVENLAVPSWHGLLAPAGTPRELVRRLNREWAKIASQEDTRERMQKAGFEPVAVTAEQFAKFIKAETARWAAVIREAMIPPAD
ncbi:MAG TPA: tripartite tricarboxylate transporter substrate binding protein [Burkholderiales bacterium]|nr:tripartite tricarboxylate transporter substrate binding protein [Burkholderiales bacterium]